MNIEQLDSGKDLDRLLTQLRRQFGVDLRLHESTREEVEQILEHYEGVKKTLKLSESFGATITHPEYTKAVLICEACRLFLHEIAPARKGAKVRTKKMQKAARRTNEDISPEVRIAQRFDQAGSNFDGKDLSRDYAADRNPKSPRSFKYDYQADDAATVSGDDPETVPLAVDGEFKVNAPGGEENVIKRYNAHRKLNPTDYNDDRDPTDMVGDNPMTWDDPMTALMNRETPKSGTVTNTGLPAELEKGMASNAGKDVDAGVNAPLNQEPRATRQREIPDPNDLQKDNNKHYNSNMREATRAMQWLKAVNSQPFFNKVFEAAQNVADRRGEDILHILNAVENVGAKYAQRQEDTEYSLAMVEALKLSGDYTKRNSIMESVGNNDRQHKLFTKLINKSKAYGLSGAASKRFAYAAHNAIFQADPIKYNIL